MFAENDDFVKWLTEKCGGVFYTVSRWAARTLWGLSNLVKWKGMERMKRRTARALCAAGLSLSLLAGLVPAMAAGPAEVADSLYINGNIYTVNEDFSTATTMAVKGDRILYVGDQAGAEAYVCLLYTSGGNQPGDRGVYRLHPAQHRGGERQH